MQRIRDESEIMILLSIMISIMIKVFKTSSPSPKLRVTVTTGRNNECRSHVSEAQARLTRRPAGRRTKDQLRAAVTSSCQPGPGPGPG